MVWPTFLELPSAPLNQVIANLNESQYWSAADLLIGQQRQLARMSLWAAQNVPFYRTIGAQVRKLAKLTEDPDPFWTAWRALPILTKAQLRNHGQQVYARRIPRTHEPIETTFTSGSTGIPVEVHITRLARLIWNALTVREHLWQGRNFHRRLGVIRFRPKTERDPSGHRYSSWGSPVANLYPTGPASVIHIGLSIDELAHWLIEFDPHYLLASPSIVTSLIDVLGTKPPALEEIRFVFEPLNLELETRLAKEWQVRSTDT